MTEANRGGVHVTAGMRLVIPAGGIRLPLDGSAAPPVSVLVSLDTTFDWLGIAFQHLRGAKAANKTLLAALQADDQSALADSLRAEFREGMQASSAAVFAVEAFAENLMERLPAKRASGLRTKWAAAKTVKYKTVAELFNVVTTFDNATSKGAREALRWMYSDRNKAVHPTADCQQPYLHPDLGSGTDWRFVLYRHKRVEVRVGEATSLIERVSNEVNPRLGKQWADESEATRQRLLACLRENKIPFSDAKTGENWEPSASV